MNDNEYNNNDVVRYKSRFLVFANISYTHTYTPPSILNELKDRKRQKQVQVLFKTVLVVVLVHIFVLLMLQYLMLIIVFKVMFCFLVSVRFLGQTNTNKRINR